MAQPDDSSLQKKKESSDLSATVPDIFAAAAADNASPAETTLMKLSSSGHLKFPGTWLKQVNPDKESKSVSFKRADSFSAVVSIGPFSLKTEALSKIRELCANEAQALQDYEIRELLLALAETHGIDGYEISAGSTELLCGRIVIVMQGFFRDRALKEALIVFPEAGAYRQLSLQAIKPEFPVYYEHFKQALKTIEWV